MAARASWADVVEVYDGYTFAVEATLEANYLAAAAKVVRRLGASGSWAIEPGSFVASLSDVLPGERFLNVSPALRQARAIKTTGELQIMYRCAEAATIGQHAFLTAARPGRTELAVFADIRCAIEEFAGERVALTGDLLSGRTRTAGGSGWPISRSLKRGDPIIADIAPRLGGYWGDSCASMMLGDPTVAFQRLHGTASLALDHALDLIRPGIMARELDRRVRNVVERAGYRYPHHTGHSLGTAVHEFPRIVPYEEATLRTDMVLMIERNRYERATRFQD